ncbi:hypothetical protein [Streptomyces sp. NPDC008150]
METESGLPPGWQQLAGSQYVLRWWGADPHPDADWHYCLVRQPQG